MEFPNGQIMTKYGINHVLILCEPAQLFKVWVFVDLILVMYQYSD